MNKMEEHTLIWFCKGMNIKPEAINPDYLLFLFDKKPSVLIFRNDEDSDEVWELKRQRFFLLTHIIKKFHFYDRNNNGNFCNALILSDKELPKDITLPKIDHQKLGKFLGYPDCCVKQFEKDFDINDNSGVICYHSAKRYLNQLKEMNMKQDPFGIEINKEKEVEFDFIPFVPCSPKCKESLKLFEEYKLILKFLEEGIKNANK